MVYRSAGNSGGDLEVAFTMGKALEGVPPGERLGTWDTLPGLELVVIRDER